MLKVQRSQRYAGFLKRFVWRNVTSIFKQNMASSIGIFALLFVPLAAATTVAPCADIDTQACVLMAAQQKDFCLDEVLAPSACKKYCNMCPLQCYHCNTTVRDFHMCTNLQECGVGQMCMRKQLKSTIDGHQEYQLTCESKQTCDGLGLVIPFGKRDVESRDISISCCGTDGCNYPAPETTTPPTTPPTTQPTTTQSTTQATTTTHRTTTHSGCYKDVIIVVDESGSMAQYHSDINHFLSNVFSRLHIGSNQVLVSLATFKDVSTKHWDLNDHTSYYTLNHALNYVHFKGGHGDLDAALDFAVQRTVPGVDGNRADAPDVVLIITDDTADSYSKESALVKQLHAHTDDVIVVGIGTSGSNSLFHHQNTFNANPVSSSEVDRVATDGQHGIFVTSSHYLYHQSSLVASLICE